MNYGYGCATGLYEQGIHPRVMLGPAELEDLKQQVREGCGKVILDVLRQRVTPLAERVLDAGDLPRLIGEWNHGWSQPGTPVVKGLFDMAMAGVLGDDRDLIDAARRVLLVMPEAQPHFGLKDRPGYSLPGVFPWAYDLLWHTFTPPERQRLAVWLLDACVRGPMQKVAGRYYRSAGGNITLHGMDIALSAILAIRGDDGVPALADELQECLRMLAATLHVVINPDGYPEEDAGYGTIVAGRMAVLAEAVGRAGLYDAYGDCPRLAAFGRAILHQVQPWGLFISNTGDHGDDFGFREFVLARQATRTGDPSLLWLLGTLTYPTTGHDPHRRNRETHHEVFVNEALPNVPATALSLLALDDLKTPPVPPSAGGIPTAFRDRGRGMISFRSGWDAEAAFVLFDGSQRSSAAQGHAHDSCGHFILSALGEYFGIGPGRYSIEQSCHNVTLIDGRSGRSTDGQWRMTYYHGNLTGYQPGEFCDYASVDSSHQHNCYWARRGLGLVKGAHPYAWTVDDINKANDWASYSWQLHTSPENEITLSGDRAVIKGWRHGNLLDVHFAIPAAHEYPRPHTIGLAQDIGGPSSFRYADAEERAREFTHPSDMLHHAVWQRPRLLATVEGLNGRLMALMLPREMGTAPAVVERLPCVDNSMALRITFADTEDILIVATAHNLLEAGGVTGRGEWCVVRCDRQSGEVLAWQLGSGSWLAFGGRRLTPVGPTAGQTHP